MPLLQLKIPLSAPAFLGVWLYIPALGRQMHELLNLLHASPDVRILWHGPVAAVPEFRARYWVDKQTGPTGDPVGGLRNYLKEQGSGEPGVASAKESVRSAVEKLLADQGKTVDTQVVIVRLIRSVALP